MRAFWRGFCCPDCGRLSCREFWRGWCCLNCGRKSDPARTLFDHVALADPHRMIFTGPPIPSNIISPEVGYTDKILPNNLRAVTYYLGSAGTVTHIIANSVTNAQPFDADWMFKEYQSPDMPFKRHPLQTRGLFILPYTPLSKADI